MKIVVLGGGISTERDVSLSSSRMIYEALKKKGHQAVLLDVYLGYEDDYAGIFEKDVDWAENIGGIKESNPDIAQIKALRKDGGRSFFGPNVIEICQMADVVFLDKSLAKELFAFHGIPTPAGIHVRKGQESAERVPYPCVVKACKGGSSVGVCIVHEEKEYQAALEEAFKYDEEAVIEQYIEGREFSCAVIDGKALPVIEIAPLCGFYDYKNKYQAGSTIETCPADLPEDKTREMQLISEKVFRALRLKKYARMDFMMDKEGKLYCLEANTLPGMTPTSLIPQEARAIGISFEDLCQWILELAQKD